MMTLPKPLMRKPVARFARPGSIFKMADADGAISRAYYAAFYMASAALELAGENPKTHSGTHGRFWRRFVETERFPAHLAQLLPHAQEQREKADYDPRARLEWLPPTIS